ncbi:MAG: ABC transporter ATP-binding protein [Pseudomonadota bacterium]|nr:ABC transporter ATP-binding protein [Pseudomonadota bacterium]
MDQAEDRVLNGGNEGPAPDPGRAGTGRSASRPWADAQARPLIRFIDVSKRFGDHTAVDRLSLYIHEGEFFALLGPSGCGKTTLLRMLAGFEQPSAGEVWLDGRDIAGVPPYRRPVNMMFQSYALFPHMTVEGNIAFGLKQDGLPKAEITARVQQMLDLVQLAPFAKRRPHQLSGGQRQRVALARSLAKRPKVLLLDEPLAALDKKLREETQFELAELQQRLGLTFVIVTHDQEEAMSLASRIAVMREGRIVQVAPPREIYERPNSRYVADFIGDINLVEGHVAGTNGGLMRIESPALGAPILVETDVVAPPGAQVWFAVRPEKTRVLLEPPADRSANLAEGEVWDIGYLGDWTVYRVKLAAGPMLRVSQANRRRTVELPVGRGDRVWLDWEQDAGIVLAR